MITKITWTSYDDIACMTWRCIQYMLLFVENKLRFDVLIANSHDMISWTKIKEIGQMKLRGVNSWGNSDVE